MALAPFSYTKTAVDDSLDAQRPSKGASFGTGTLLKQRIPA